MKSVLKFILFVGLGTGILYFVYLNQSEAYQLECLCTGNCVHESLIQKIGDDFKGVNLFWIVVVCFCFMLSNISRALRWNMLIHELGYKPRMINSFFATMVGYMVNLALPRAGEIAKPATMAKYEKVPVDKLIGTIVVDRVFDIIMLIIVTLLTFLTQFNALYSFLFDEKKAQECVGEMPEQTTSTIPWDIIIMGVSGIMIVAVLILLTQRDRLKKHPFYQKLLVLLSNFKEGFQTVFKLRSPSMFLFHTLVIWIMYYLMMYLCFFAYAPTAGLSPLAALLAFTFGTFGIVIPSPGGMGTYQIAVTAALVVYGLSESNAFAFSNIIFFAISIFCNIAFGIVAFLLLPLVNKNYDPEIPN